MYDQFLNICISNWFVNSIKFELGNIVNINCPYPLVSWLLVPIELDHSIFLT